MLRQSPRHAFALVFLLAISANVPSAQQPPQTRTPERGEDLRSVHFLAVSEDGTPVADLRADEVKVRIGGRERAVRSLQLIVRESGAADTALPPPFATNATSAGGRRLILVIDEDSARPGREAPLRQAVDALIARLGPADRLMLATVPLGGVRVPFTTDHTKIKLALANIVGQAPATETGSEFACRSRRTLEVLASFLENAGVREEPATLMFVTSGLAAPRRDALSGRAPGMCELSENLYNRVAAAAAAARTPFYVIRPGDAPSTGPESTVDIGSTNPIAGIEHLVGVTKGKLLALTGSAGTAMDRVLRETSAFYVASVDSHQNDFTGRPQQLDVRVSRRGVELRTLPQITFANDPASARLSSPSLRDMFGTLQVFRDLPLRAAGYPALSGEEQKVRVVVLAEPAEAGVKLESVAAVLFDPDGRVAGQWVASSEELQRPTVMGAMDALPGGYRLRVAAIDTTGRSGTADYELVAEVVRSGPLKLSALVLGLSRDGAFVPKLQFSNEPLGVAYVELEGAAAGARVNAALEIARTMNGPAVVNVPLAIDATGENRYRAMGSVPLGALPPGDYVARAVIGLEGHPLTRVVRTIRKVAPAR